MEREKRLNRSRWCVWLLAGALAAGYLVLGAGTAYGEQKIAATKAGDSGKAAAPAAPARTPPPAQAPPPPVEAPKPPNADAAGAPVGTVTTSRDAEGKIELHVKNEELANVLELLSREYQLNMIASKGAKGRVTLDLYKVSVDQVLDALCRSSGLKWIRQGNSIYIHTPEEMLAIENEESRLTTEVFPLNYLAAEEAQKIVMPALSAKATVAVSSLPGKGIPTGASGDTGSNSFGLQDTLVIRDYPEHLEQVRAILKKMDRRPRQVLVEATILKVELDDTTSLGIDFNTLAGIDFRDLSRVATPLLNPTLPAGAAVPVTTPATNSKWGSVGTSGFAQPGDGLNIGVITNNVAFFISALESVKDATTLSNPKVLALNKQRAEVIVGQRLGYKTTTTTETTTVQTIEFLDSGTQLIFRPFISDDGYIRMEVHPKVSTGLVDPATGLPSETTTEVTCNIMVKDGHTIVIGGLFGESASVGRSQVPGLGNLPGVGWLFRNKADKTNRNEIIILLTPHIIEDEDAANALGEDMLAQGKRLCLGLREGFTFFTRERITSNYMQAANEAWQRYQKTKSRKDLDSALWNVSLSLGASPNNIKGLQLKDEIYLEKTGEPYEPPNWTIWDTIGDRLKDMDEAKKEAPKPGAPPPPPPEAKPPAGPTSAAAATKGATHAN
jgi:type IV pilus secretin PilQ/predicted competence protein